MSGQFSLNVIPNNKIFALLKLIFFHLKYLKFFEQNNLLISSLIFLEDNKRSGITPTC